MSLFHRHLGRYGLALLGAALFVGCSSGGTDNNNPGTISLGLNPTSGTVVQGGQTTVAATLTRGGGFTGTVNLTVTGAPATVTATVSNVVTTGTTTTATVTVVVGAATATGVYPLVVHGTGTGVTEATATYTLTVTAPGSFTLAVTPAGGVTMVQGTSDNSKTISITRTNYAPGITLTAENLPAGLTASFAPNPATANSSVLTLTATASLAPNTYNLTIRGTGPAGLRVPGGELAAIEATTTLAVTVAAPTPSFTLALTQATLSIAQGASTPTTTVNITRVNFPGDVTLSVLNLPTGVTAAFAPANPQQGNSSVLTLTVVPGAPTGTFNNLSVQGVGTPGTVATPLTLTITTGTPAGNYTLTTTPATNVSLTQGTSTPVTVNINRTGGNTSDITLTATGTLPTGMSLGFLPSPTTTNSSTLTITTTGATPVGATPIVIHGNTAGLAEQTVNLTINVTAPSGSGNVSVSFASCATSDKAVWLAFMDGTGGTWTAVTGVADVYHFNITQSKGSFAYVTLSSGDSQIFVEHMTQAELTAGTFTFCPAPPPAGETINGTTSNIATGFSAFISFAGRGSLAFFDGPFVINDAPDGTFDLVGYMREASLGSGDRVFIKRGENPTNGGNFTVPVNFLATIVGGNGSASAAAASATLTGLTGGETTLSHSMTYFTGGSACTPATLYFGATAAANFNMYGVPTGLRIAGDMHSISIIVSNGSTSSRILGENFFDPVARALNPFVLPAQLPVPVASDAGGPYKRPQVVVTGVPAEFNLSHSMSYEDQSSTNDISGFITATQGWVGGSTVTLVLPNFAGVGTFNNAWAPATSDGVQWTASSSGGAFTSACAAGQRFVTASRTGTL